MNKKNRSACGLIVAVLFAGFSSARANDLPVLDCVIEPYEVIEVSSAAEGVLERIHVERNDLVTRGQIVAELESDVEKASLAYAQFNASLSSEIKLRRASLEFDERNRERIQELYTKNAIPLHHTDEANTDAAKSRWLLSKAEDDKRLAALEYARASAVLKRKTVRSPISGVVIARHKSTGEYIEDQAIITVAQLHPLRVEVIAPVELFGTITSGMRANITPELATTGPLTATVMSVDRVIDGESGTFDVRLELPNPDYTIPSGLKCEIAFKDAPAPGEVGVPQPPPVAPTPAEIEPELPPHTDDVDLREASSPLDATDVATPLVSAAPASGSPAETAAAMSVTPAIPPPAAGAQSAARAEPAATEPLPVDPGPSAVVPQQTANVDPAPAPIADAASLTDVVADAGAEAGAVCRIIGPFKTDADAERLMATFDPVHLSATPVKRTEEVVHSYILASPLVPERGAKDAIAARIAEHGVKDTALLHKGPLKDRYSFGVYNNQVVAAIKQRALKKLGFEIEMLPRTREVARWWLEVVSNSADGTLLPLPSGDTGGKLTTAACAPGGATVGNPAASMAAH